MHRGLLEEEKERQADTCSVSTRRRRDPGNSRRPLVSDLQMCKDWQRARLGSSPKFGSGCAEFPASGRSVHETVGLCVSWGEEAEVVALGPDRRLQGAFENETVRTFPLCHLVRVFVASQSQVVTAPHAQLPILVQEEAGRGKWEGWKQETVSGKYKSPPGPPPVSCWVQPRSQPHILVRPSGEHTAPQTRSRFCSQGMKRNG